ncbi:hypothetical protein DPMN_105010 [Dreissena polymorpha]|uniref:Uncharacterized protein n=1 Tax=Dreissena polymorpha TaxID=45954 RepID=A0A9D4K1J5_DREPO|nr:hypothetical protein DPMN_105010 [Dreissena polymorpha]
MLHLAVSLKLAGTPFEILTQTLSFQKKYDNTNAAADEDDEHDDCFDHDYSKDPDVLDSDDNYDDDDLPLTNLKFRGKGRQGDNEVEVDSRRKSANRVSSTDKEYGRAGNRETSNTEDVVEENNSEVEIDSFGNVDASKRKDVKRIFKLVEGIMKLSNGPGNSEVEDNNLRNDELMGKNKNIEVEDGSQ